MTQTDVMKRVVLKRCLSAYEDDSESTVANLRALARERGWAADDVAAAVEDLDVLEWGVSPLQPWVRAGSYEAAVDQLRAYGGPR